MQRLLSIPARRPEVLTHFGYRQVEILRPTLGTIPRRFPLGISPCCFSLFSTGHVLVVHELAHGVASAKLLATVKKISKQIYIYIYPLVFINETIIYVYRYKEVAYSRREYFLLLKLYLFKRFNYLLRNSTFFFGRSFHATLNMFLAYDVGSKHVNPVMG